ERDEDSVPQARTRAVADGEQVARRAGQGGLTRGDRVEQFGELRNALAPGRVAQQGDRHGRRGGGCGSGDSGGEYGRSRRAERVQADQRAREDVVAERRQPWSAAEQPPARRMDGLPATQSVNQFGHGRAARLVHRVRDAGGEPANRGRQPRGWGGTETTRAGWAPPPGHPERKAVDDEAALPHGSDGARSGPGWCGLS